MFEDEKLGLKVATKEEAYWIAVRDLEKMQILKLENSIKQCERDLQDLNKGLKLHKEILLMSALKIKREERKQK